MKACSISKRVHANSSAKPENRIHFVNTIMKSQDIFLARPSHLLLKSLQGGDGDSEGLGHPLQLGLHPLPVCQLILGGLLLLLQLSFLGIQRALQLAELLLQTLHTGLFILKILGCLGRHEKTNCYS